MEYKEIICLANSIKLGGRCVAGKEIDNHSWIRPVSELHSGELSEDQIKYVNGEDPKLLEIIKIPFKSKSPKCYQPENLIVGDGKWQKTGRFREEDLDKICENPLVLWDNNHPDNGKISLGYLKSHPPASSLLLIKVDLLKIVRSNYEEEKKYRAVFNYNGEDYDLPVTDPKIRKEYENNIPGDYLLGGKKFYVCVSLGAPFKKIPNSSEDACCYKLVAAIIYV
ncbi:MAG: hypothetical protein FD145_1501 [Candidatus Saganbacteria bacterium]|uniref:Dual OB-containing domain-containing protein n=1 Tax=Candidatus Saganbacteria bacterium TaxID=2575572 RepID=A0A833L2P1_UNCSA|nr:MAG: hypothetical protein FD145_1501 [Candidatus Saganbacteria bacterium]